MESSCAGSENVKWYGHFGEHAGSFSKVQTQSDHMTQQFHSCVCVCVCVCVFVCVYAYNSREMKRYDNQKLTHKCS
jgi:hypothetical protein